jgi:hypothetical protein
MATTSCYSMTTTVATSTPTTMISSISITSLPSSIYGPSSVTFVNDTNAYTTVDINMSKITSINSWCPQNNFTVNTVT